MSIISRPLFIYNFQYNPKHTNIYIIYMWKGKQSPAHLFRSDIVRSCYTLILDGKNVKYCIIIIMIHIDNNLRIQMISSQCFGRLKLMQLYFLTRKIPYTINLRIVFPKCTKDLKTSILVLLFVEGPFSYVMLFSYVE